MTIVPAVPVSMFGAADYNPPHRQDPRYVSDLVRSIEQIGQVVPVLAAKDGDRYRLIDGHRRLAACDILGRNVDVIVLDESLDAATVYAEVNSKTKRLRGSDILTVYLANPSAVESSAREFLDGWQRGTLETIRKHKGSHATLRQAKHLAKYCGCTGDAAAKWLAKNKMTYQARQAVEQGIDPNVLRYAIEKGRPLRHRWEAA